MEFLSLALFLLVTIAVPVYSENASSLKEAAAETASVEHQVGDLVQALDAVIGKPEIGGDTVEEENVPETTTEDDIEEVTVMDVAMDEDTEPNSTMADISEKTNYTNLIIIVAVYTTLALVLGIVPLWLCICLCKKTSSDASQPQEELELQEQDNLLQEEDRERAADFL